MLKQESLVAFLVTAKPVEARAFYEGVLGLSLLNEHEHGVVFDPIRNEIFYASRGYGAQLNDKRIRVSQRNDMHSAVLGLLIVLLLLFVPNGLMSISRHWRARGKRRGSQA